MWKKIILFILIQLFIIINPCFPQGNWEQILPPYPTSNQLVSLDFIDEHTGWAVGEYGTIVKTTDGGENWKLIEIPWLDYLLDINFPSTMTGYAVGQNGQIIKSTDGGESWDKQSIKYTNNLNRVRFRDEWNGWIVGEKGLILHTTNGGSEWYQQVSNSRGDLKGIGFINDSSLCAVGTDTTILICDNKGKNWQPSNIKFSEGVTLEYNYIFRDIFFLNDTLGWICGARFRSTRERGVILKTTNSGKSWIEELNFESFNYFEDYGGEKSASGRDGVFPFGLQQIYFSDLNKGLYLINAAQLYVLYIFGNVTLYTENSGKYLTSTICGRKESSDQTGRFCFLNDTDVINTGFGGEFRFSTDSGLTWKYPDYSQRLFSKMVFGNDGRILALKKLKSYFSFFRSNDYGRNWESFEPQVFDNTGKNINIQLGKNSLYFLDIYQDNQSKTLWIIDRYQEKIFKSDDFGLTWQLVKSGVNKNLFQFLSPDTLILYDLQIVEKSPDIYVSELVFNYSFDGGITVNSDRFPGLWNDIIPPSTGLYEVEKYIHDCYFFDGCTGFITGSDGNIVKTTDTGQSWISINSGVVENLFDIEFIDRSVGFIAGEFGRILKTEDGGETWRKTDSGTQETIYSVGFKNEYEGWAGTESGLRYTIDGGETWYGVPLRYKHGLIRNIEFDESGNGYAYTLSPKDDAFPGIKRIIPGGYNLLLCFKAGSNWVNNNQDNELNIKDMKLEPNYPNPFNLHTKIGYQLPESGSVSLKVYNIQGRLVRTLLDEVKKAGEYNVFWDGSTDNDSEVTSGIYIYKLQKRGQVKTRKMVVLK
jgi:photosystem II stability/assembly factor-like uncharacterized protein